MDIKTVGYLLLSIGLFVLSFSTINIYQVFTGRTHPYQLISQKELSFNLSQFLPEGQSTSSEDSGKKTQLELLSADTINNSANLMFHLALMTFISASGFKIAILGVQLLRPINIKSSVLS